MYLYGRDAGAGAVENAVADAAAAAAAEADVEAFAVCEPVGGLFALAMSVVARRWLPISAVVAFLIVGLLLGPRVLDVIDGHAIHMVEPLTAVALGAIVFVNGGKLRLREIRRIRRTLLPISLLGSALAFAVCLVALLAVRPRR